MAEATNEDLRALRQEMSQMRDAVNKVADALNRLTLVEERQQNTHGQLARVLEQLEDLTAMHHQAELHQAKQGDLAGRVERLEGEFRVLHVEREKEQARQATALFLMKGLWAFCGVVGTGGVIWLARLLGGG